MVLGVEQFVAPLALSLAGISYAISVGTLSEVIPMQVQYYTKECLGKAFHTVSTRPGFNNIDIFWRGAVHRCNACNLLLGPALMHIDAKPCLTAVGCAKINSNYQSIRRRASVRRGCRTAICRAAAVGRRVEGIGDICSP